MSHFKRSFLIGLCAGVEIVSFVLLGFSLMMFTDSDMLTEAIITSIVGGVLLPISLFFGVVFEKELKLKYIFLGKNFKKQLGQSLSKFQNANEEFVKLFTKSAKFTYRRTGSVISVWCNDWAFEQDDFTEKSLKIYYIVYHAIVSKGGFIEICEELQKLKNEFIIEPDEDMCWIVNKYLFNSMASEELKFLFHKVMLLSKFNLVDKGFSPRRTEELKQIKERLNVMYTPVLMSFEEEVKNTLKLLSEIQKGNK